MAKVCDRCLERKCFKTITDFKKVQKTSPRVMLKVEMELCEACISDWLKLFGKFKVAFLKMGDEPEPPPGEVTNG